MRHEMFIVRNVATYYGPFLSYESETFASTLEGDATVIPLVSPEDPEEVGIKKVHFLEDDAYRTLVDGFKVDTYHSLVGITQEIQFARLERRVLTARELRRLQQRVYEVGRTVESLMHYVEKVVGDPSQENLEALRKAFWRNRNSDDVDPHYDERFC